MVRLSRAILRPLGDFFDRRFSKIREINRKYRTPHVEMTPAVKFALLFLRLYLLFLVGLLFFKFFADVVVK